MIKKMNLKIEVHQTLDRQLTLKDIYFVVTQFCVRCLDTRVCDEGIHNSYGMLGQETNGAGGMFKVFRTIPIVTDIVNDVKKTSKT